MTARAMPDPQPPADLFAAIPVPLPAPARLRVASWADPDARPDPAERCSVCWGGWWWQEATPPRRGWRCACCIPPSVGLAVEQVGPG